MAGEVTEAQKSAARAFCQILRDRTGHRWELIGDGNPSSAPDGKLNTGTFPEHVEPVGVSGPNHDRVEGRGK